MSEKTAPKQPRIIGIDVARAFAVIGMIIVNFKVVFGDHGAGLLRSFASLFDGKAAATFVVLAGIGLALMTKTAIQTHDEAKWIQTRRKILRRALFLFFVGLSYVWIWPADILHFYGIYMLVTLLFIRRSPTQILWGTIALILLYPVLVVCFDYAQGWDFTTLAYLDFWTIDGFLRNLFFNGFHPVMPWTAFMLFGLWFGQQNLHDDKFLKKSLWVGTSVFLSVQVLSAVSMQTLSQGSSEALAELKPLLGTDPMPPMPLYMLNGISISTVVISLCILWAKRFSHAKVIGILYKTGKLALTFYVAHVIIGMGLVETFGPKDLGEYSVQFSVVYALAFSMLCFLFAELWLKHKQAGPLEWVMRKLTD